MGQNRAKRSYLHMYLREIRSVLFVLLITQTRCYYKSDIFDIQYFIYISHYNHWCQVIHDLLCNNTGENPVPCTTCSILSWWMFCLIYFRYRVILRWNINKPACFAALELPLWQYMLVNIYMYRFCFKHNLRTESILNSTLWHKRFKH